ncbi:MAG: flagellar hook-associated protein FlgK [Rhodomicrobiaceae bacterium]
MSLTSSMDTARSSLSVLSERTAVTSRNVANAQNEYATRKIAQTFAGPGGSGVRLATLTRASDDALFQNLTVSNSAAAQYQAIVQSLDQLNFTVNDVEDNQSPAAALGKLADSLQQAAAAPQEPGLAQNAVFSAIDAATKLNEATATVQQVRTRADKGIADAVNNLNTMLGRFEELNRDIVDGTRSNRDVTDLLDSRDKLLADMSREIGIRTVTRENNDMVIFTDSGVTMFETTARPVSFAPSGNFTAGTTGNAVLVDGVRVTGNASPLPIASGRIRGLAEVRDEIAVTYQNQLDEVARGLITAFAESDQSAIPALPDATGLFSYSGSPAVPAAGTLIPGLAGQIQVNPAVDPAQGGDPFLLRDGGINGAAYVYNSSGAAGFSDRLRELQDNFYVPAAFDPSAQIDASATLVDFASNSVGWLQEMRQNAASEFEFRSTVYERSLDTLSNKTGINLDLEMTLLLELERSYQATSRLISTIDNMYQSLILATG